MPGILSEIVAAITAISSGSIDCSEDHLLKMPAGCKWPFATNNVLFVREYYSPVYEDVLNECKFNETKDRQYIVTGQPGIGKTVFGWYIIYRLLTDTTRSNQTILYLHQDLEGMAVVIEKSPEGCRVSDVRVDKILKRGNFKGTDVVSICDTVAPPALSGVIVEIASPGSLQMGRIKEAVKEYPKEIYMPLHSREEVILMNNSVTKQGLTKLTKEAVEARMDIWGPVPRMIFGYYSFEAQQKEVETLLAMTSNNILDAYDCIRKKGGDGKNPHHRLFLDRAAGQDSPELDIRSCGFYVRGSSVVASPLIAAWLMGAVKGYKALQNADFILLSAGVGEHGARRRTLFEDAAIIALLKGGNFTVKVLSDGLSDGRKVSWTVSKHLVKVDWDSAWSPTELERKAASQTMLIPQVKNKAGLDALLWLDRCGHHIPIDFTVGAKHGINMKGLKKNLADLRSRGWKLPKGWLTKSDTASARQVDYVWVVPEDRFASWTLAQTAKLNSNDVIGQHLVQYALEMPFNKLFEAVDEKKGTSEIRKALDIIKATTECGVQSKRRKK